jgi:predicted lipid-binding transport protein (Tim44 family)
LWILSISLSVYNVATAQDKTTAALHEARDLGVGLAGGMAGGAIAGLMCGPGAPVCVTVGVFVGGALAVLGVQAF